jgi:hypothetical protein
MRGIVTLRGQALIAGKTALVSSESGCVGMILSSYLAGRFKTRTGNLSD